MNLDPALRLLFEPFPSNLRLRDQEPVRRGLAALVVPAAIEAMEALRDEMGRTDPSVTIGAELLQEAYLVEPSGNAFLGEPVPMATATLVWSLEAHTVTVRVGINPSFLKSDPQASRERVDVVVEGRDHTFHVFGGRTCRIYDNVLPLPERRALDRAVMRVVSTANRHMPDLVDYFRRQRVEEVRGLEPRPDPVLAWIRQEDPSRSRLPLPALPVGDESTRTRVLAGTQALLNAIAELREQIILNDAPLAHTAREAAQLLQIVETFGDVELVDLLRQTVAYAEQADDMRLAASADFRAQLRRLARESDRIMAIQLAQSLQEGAVSEFGVYSTEALSAQWYLAGRLASMGMYTQTIELLRDYESKVEMLHGRPALNLPSMAQRCRFLLRAGLPEEAADLATEILQMVEDHGFDAPLIGRGTANTSKESDIQAAAAVAPAPWVEVEDDLDVLHALPDVLTDALLACTGAFASVEGRHDAQELAARVISYALRRHSVRDLAVHLELTIRELLGVGAVDAAADFAVRFASQRLEDALRTLDSETDSRTACIDILVELSVRLIEIGKHNDAFNLLQVLPAEPLDLDRQRLRFDAALGAGRVEDAQDALSDYEYALQVRADLGEGVPLDEPLLALTLDEMRARLLGAASNTADALWLDGASGDVTDLESAFEISQWLEADQRLPPVLNDAAEASSVAGHLTATTERVLRDAFSAFGTLDRLLGLPVSADARSLISAERALAANAVLDAVLLIDRMVAFEAEAGLGSASEASRSDLFVILRPWVVDRRMSREALTDPIVNSLVRHTRFTMEARKLRPSVWNAPLTAAGDDAVGRLSPILTAISAPALVFADLDDLAVQATELVSRVANAEAWLRQSSPARPAARSDADFQRLLEVVRNSGYSGIPDIARLNRELLDVGEAAHRLTNQVLYVRLARPLLQDSTASSVSEVGRRVAIALTVFHRLGETVDADGSSIERQAAATNRRHVLELNVSEFARLVRDYRRQPSGLGQGESVVEALGTQPLSLIEGGQRVILERILRWQDAAHPLHTARSEVQLVPQVIAARMQLRLADMGDLLDLVEVLGGPDAPPVPRVTAATEVRLSALGLSLGSNLEATLRRFRSLIDLDPQGVERLLDHVSRFVPRTMPMELGHLLALTRRDLLVGFPQGYASVAARVFDHLGHRPANEYLDPGDGGIGSGPNVPTPSPLNGPRPGGSAAEPPPSPEGVPGTDNPAEPDRNTDEVPPDTPETLDERYVTLLRTHLLASVEAIQSALGVEDPRVQEIDPDNLRQIVDLAVEVRDHLEASVSDWVTLSLDDSRAESLTQATMALGVELAPHARRKDSSSVAANAGSDGVEAALFVASDELTRRVSDEAGRQAGWLRRTVSSIERTVREEPVVAERLVREMRDPALGMSHHEPLMRIIDEVGRGFSSDRLCPSADELAVASLSPRPMSLLESAQLHMSAPTPGGRVELALRSIQRARAVLQAGDRLLATDCIEALVPASQLRESDFPHPETTALTTALVEASDCAPHGQQFRNDVMSDQNPDSPVTTASPVERFGPIPGMLHDHVESIPDALLVDRVYDQPAGPDVVLEGPELWIAGPPRSPDGRY